MKIVMSLVTSVIIFLLITGYTNNYSSTAETDSEPVKKVEIENDSDVAYDNVKQSIDENAKKVPTSSEKSIIPVSVEIPSIEVEAKVENVGILENGQMGVPSNHVNVGWFEPGFEPGATGNSVIAGHVDSKTGPSVFYHLEDLSEGDEVFVTNKDGETLTFVVTGKERYPFQNAPIEKIFGPTDDANLNLITCTGNFSQSHGTHEERLVVFTELKAE
ncbi:class F sortase [Guptibacillus algicola]|uniref:class F sortase n=1 Tax=Guptibacillus algicola TaxID=225844 RepID=UPI001CD47B9D|nr:class F sortase [Alkalihalobacillus algicola]MCA0986731.1 class F sortase [Alkalihalobacillus algicola]